MMQRPTGFVLYVWVAAALVFLTPAANAGKITSRLFKVLELNFNSEIVACDDRDEKIRDRRFAAMIEYIKQEDPDVILLNEGWNYQDHPSVAIPLAAATGYNYHYRLVEG